VSGERHQVDAEAVDIEVEGACGLDGVGVKGDAAVEGLDDADEIGDRLDSADFVVGRT